MLKSRVLIGSINTNRSLARSLAVTGVRYWGDDSNFRGEYGAQRGGGGFGNRDGFGGNFGNPGGYGGFGNRGGGGNFGNSGGYGGFGNRGGGRSFGNPGGFGRRFDHDIELTKKADFTNLPPLKKDFYREHPDVTKRDANEIEGWIKKNNITLDGKDIPRPLFRFDEAGFPEEIAQMLREKYTEPSPIQAISWPSALCGRDLISIAQTGSGKTLGFMLPALVHSINQPQHESPHVLVMTPTRELCQQVNEVAADVANRLGLRTALCFGGGYRNEQSMALRAGPQIVVGVPGRTMDFINSGILDLTKTSYVVLDEADRMLDMGFERDIRKILSVIRPDRQTLMFSATWPKEVQSIARNFQNDPVFLNVGSLELSANPNITQIIHVMEMHEKARKIVELIQELRQDPKFKMLIFTSMKRTADDLMYTLRRAGMTSALCIHGDKSQGERDFAMNEFRRAACRMLVATDVAARGIDVVDITHVINYDMPKSIDDYVHRIGRTARAGRKGTAISFFTMSDSGLARALVRQLEETNQNIPQELQRFAGSR